MSDKIKWEKKDVPIKDLSLWDENPRFPQEYFSKTETELVNYFLGRRELEIPGFAKEVVDDFDLPQLEKIVVLELDGKNIVLEGNRRLVVYKLLANPELIEKTSDFRVKFEELKKRINISDSFTLEVNATTNKDDGLRYISRKHNKNNNEVGWGETERRRFAIRRSDGGMKDIVRVALADEVKKVDLPTPIKEAVLGKGFITTFYRVADSPAAKAILAYEPKEDGTLKIDNRTKFQSLLKIITYNIWKKSDFQGKKIDSRSLNKMEAINEYVKQLKEDDVAKVDEDIKKNTVTNLFGGKTITPSQPGQPRRTPVSKDSDELFGRILILQSGKVNDLYRALVEVDKKCKDNDSILPFLGMSLRLLVEVAARVYYDKQNNAQNAKTDQVCETFLKEAKKKMKQPSKNEISLTNEWLSDQRNLGAILDKYAHGNIIYKRADILKDSVIVADILEFYFKKN